MVRSLLVAQSPSSLLRFLGSPAASAGRLGLSRVRDGQQAPEDGLPLGSEVDGRGGALEALEVDEAGTAVGFGLVGWQQFDLLNLATGSESFPHGLFGAHRG